MAVPTKAAAYVASSPCFTAFRNAQVVSSLAEGSAKKYIGTHNGTFHCDEALAVSMLKLLPRFAPHTILRTRDEAKLTQCEIVVDVGGIYDPETCRFDHHQRSFTTTFDQREIKLSSAGLVYKHFGREIIQVLAAPTTLDEDSLSIVHQKAYKNFIEHIDGIDNGVEVATAGDAKLTYNYQVSTSLSCRVGYLNPRWNEDQSEQRVNEQFQQAMFLTITEFTDAIQDLVHSWLPARKIVEQAVVERFQTHKSGEIVSLPAYCPWKSHLHDLEEKLSIPGQIKFVLYKDETGNMTRVQAINVEPGSFALRKGLLPAWRSLRDQELSHVAGIEGCTFVHNAGFIGGNRTFEGALDMAVNEVTVMSEAEIAPANTEKAPMPDQKPAVRGRYAKFNGTMDVMLLEALQVNNPFTAKHGTRLQMWQNVAESVGMQGFKNPAAISWHTCRDRVTALMKMYTDGKHDKLFKHGTMEENSRKETILREINDTLIRKNHKMAGWTMVDGNGQKSVIMPKTEASSLSTSDSSMPPQKRRKVDASVGVKTAAESDIQEASSSENFRARILELMESKLQFDIDQRQKEAELRAQEIELQKRFLEYLQAK
ncbi:hypothetical protein PsorP6_011156 [Peronosclerospora sorghi]|uniref:Uncharacterized protein n=1 Tax=Peronosclerospora sorghi TaxID=230839 RepID=A0ACC0VVH5_9STRA|nr:hypothetical protein PsorP6_011156 [Peronosclerospora sorghi]